MTAPDVDAIRARADAANEGPWAWASRTTIDGDEWAVFDPTDHALASNRDGWAPDAEFIAHAREDVPALLAEVERLRVERDQAREEAARWKAAWDMAESLRTKRDRAREATIARVRTLADSWDDVIAVERHLHGDRSARLVADAQADLLAAIEGTDS